MHNIITIAEIKSWNYYQWKCKNPNFPTVPKKVEELISSRTQKSNEPFKVLNHSTLISLRSFRRRIKNYLKDHLPNQEVNLFNPNFKNKKP